MLGCKGHVGGSQVLNYQFEILQNLRSVSLHFSLSETETKGFSSLDITYILLFWNFVKKHTNFLLILCISLLFLYWTSYRHTWNLRKKVSSIHLSFTRFKKSSQVGWVNLEILWQPFKKHSFEKDTFKVFHTHRFHRVFNSHSPCSILKGKVIVKIDFFQISGLGYLQISK